MRSINKLDKHGNTPLMIAAAKGSGEEVVKLLNEGADPHVKDRDGMTAKTRGNRGYEKIVILLEEAESNYHQETAALLEDAESGYIPENDNMRDNKSQSAGADETQKYREVKYVAPAITNNGGEQINVIVTDIDMPFGSMVSFMVKWVIASIPAFIILFLLFSIVSAIFGGIIAGLNSTSY